MNSLETECWYWAGSVQQSGYGSIWDKTKKKNLRAHRAVYEALVGKIPEGLVLDHLCMNKLCVNPEHLEAVTQRENMRRCDYSTRYNPRANIMLCPHGHSLDRIRMHYDKAHRECGTCKRIRDLHRSEIRSIERAERRRRMGLPPHHRSKYILPINAQIG
jgi:HNH endonuclease